MWVITDYRKITAIKYVVTCDGYGEDRTEDIKKRIKTKGTLSYYKTRGVPCLTLKSIDVVADVDAVLEKLKEMARVGTYAMLVCGDTVLLYAHTQKYDGPNLENLVDMVSYELQSKENLIESW